MIERSISINNYIQLFYYTKHNGAYSQQYHCRRDPYLQVISVHSVRCTPVLPPTVEFVELEFSENK